MKIHSLKSLIVRLMISLLMLGVFQVSYAAGPGWTANSTVVSLVAVYNGGVNVRLSPELEGCVSQSGYGAQFASVYPGHPGLKNIKSDLMAAYLAGKTISLYFSDNTCNVTESILGGWN